MQQTSERAAAKTRRDNLIANAVSVASLLDDAWGAVEECEGPLDLTRVEQLQAELNDLLQAVARLNAVISSALPPALDDRYR